MANTYAIAGRGSAGSHTPSPGTTHTSPCRKIGINSGGGTAFPSGIRNPTDSANARRDSMRKWQASFVADPHSTTIDAAV